MTGHKDEVKARAGKTVDVEARTLEMAGLLGGVFSLPLLEAAVGSAAGVEALFDKGVLTEGKRPGEGRFVKAAQTAKVAAAIPWSRRRAHFAALGEAAAELRHPPEAIAPYYERGQHLQTAREWWVKAARKACAAGAYPRAMTWLDRALSIWPWTESPAERVEILRELARCALNGGRVEPARRAWEELADYGADAGEPAIEVEALRHLAQLGTDAARISEWLRRAAKVAERELPAAEAVRTILAHVDNLASRVRVAAAAAELERAVRMAEAAADPALLSEVRGWQGLIAAMSGKHARAGDYVAESLQLAVDHELAEQAALAYRRRANIQDYGGRYAEEKQAHTAAIAYCRTSNTSGELVCMGCLSYACLRTGDWQEAARIARAVIRDAASPPTLRALASCVLGLVQAFRGERAPAARNLQAAMQCFHAEGYAGMAFFGLWGLAYLRRLDEDAAGAIEIFDQIRALWRTTDDLHDVVPALLFAGAVYADADHPDRLADCLDILGSVLRGNPLAETQAALSALQAELARHDGRQADFDAGMADAAAQYAALGLPVEQVWTTCRRVVHGTAPATDAARTNAATIAKRLGMRPMLTTLQAARDNAPAATGDLTPRQTEVLYLLAEGLTSKEIADRLGLSTRTVEMHVSRLLQRLHCRTRPEAIRIALTRGWLQASSRSAIGGQDRDA